MNSLSTTVHRDTIATPLVEAVAQPFRDALTNYPYAIPEDHRDFLSDAGINITDYGSLTHPHPVHKTIELNLLQNVWPHQATTESSVMFMKPSKFEKLKRRNPNFAHLNNFRLTPQDTTRYPETASSLPNTETVFIHDALMYFEPAQILGLFKRKTSVQKVYASLVVPPESEFTNITLNPDLYKIQFNEDQLIYHLENNPAHSYSQPRSAIQWLKTSAIIGGGLSLSVTKLDSWGPVHSILIQRGLAPMTTLHTKATFKSPSAILLPAPNALHQDVRHRLVPSKVYHAIFAYVRAVRTLRTTDPAGFIRTQSNKKEYNWVTSAAWDNLQHFALHTSPHRPVSHYLLFKSPFQRLKFWFKTHEFHMFCLYAAACAPAAAYTTYQLTWLTTTSIQSLAILNHWIIPPPSFFPEFLIKFFRAKAPTFQIRVEPRQLDLFGMRCLRTITNRLDIFKRFHPAKFPTWGKYAVLVSAAVPLALLAWRWFQGPDTPQSLHDQYQQYFHPEEWQLTLDVEPVACEPKAFLELPESTPAQTFDPKPDLHPPPPAKISSKPIPPAVPLEISSIEDEKTEEIPSTLSTQLAEISSKLASAPTPKAQISSKPQESKPVEISSKLVFPDQTEVPMAVDGIALLNAPTQPKPDEWRPGSQTPERPSEPIRPALGELNSQGMSVEAPVTNEPVRPPHDPMLDDFSGLGPVLPWSVLHPRTFRGHSGEFLTRARNGPPSQIPYPPTNDCLLQAIFKTTNIHPDALWATLCAELPDSLIRPEEIAKHGLNTDHLTVLATIYDFSCDIQTPDGLLPYGVEGASASIKLKHTAGNPGHFEPLSDPSPSRLTGARSADLRHCLLGFRSDGHLLPFSKVHSYRTSLHRAKNLISNMKNGFDGIMANVDPHHPNRARDAFLAMDAALDIAAAKEVNLIHLAGFAGCGKSYPVQKLLQTSAFHNYRVSLPTTELRSEWKQALQLKSHNAWRVSTWEAALLKNARVLVIDEVYKMPRGYLDLAIHCDPTLELVIVLGDPLQGEYHSTHPSSNNHRLLSEVKYLRPFLDFYCLWSRRIPRNVADFFQIKTLNPLPGFFRHVPGLPESSTILSNSNNASLTLAQCGYKSITIASSQGSTYDGPATIQLDKNSALLSPSHSLVALTRSRSGVLFVGDKTLLAGSPGANYLFSNFFQGHKINLFHLFASQLQGVHILREPISSRRFTLSGAGGNAFFNLLFSAEISSKPAPCPEISSTDPCPEISSTGPTPAADSAEISSKPQLRSPAISSTEIVRASVAISSTAGAKHVLLPDPKVPNLLSRFGKSLPSAYTGDVIRSAKIFSGSGEEASSHISTHFLPETRRPLHYDIASAQTSNPAPSCNFECSNTAHTPVYPGEHFETLAAQFIPAHDPEIKEIMYRDQSSNQFPYLDQMFSIGAQPSSLAAPVHSSKNDPTLLPASIGKRLRFRESSAPYQISPKDEQLGNLLYSALCRAYHREATQTVPFDPELYIECINANEFAQLSSKTQSVIMANAYRSDPDWRWSAVRIFSKTQHKVNEHSLFGDWKACQTLALMHDAAILLLGPVKKYQRIFDAQDRPSNIYVHASKTPYDLSTWCRNHLTSAVHVANDYTSFDQSQHGEAVVLERKKMERLSIPDNLINLHVFLKTNVATQFGPLTCMRLTGEPGTYDDNTDYNLAVLYSQYSITTQGVMVSGDDSLINSLPPTRFDWPSIEPLLSLRFKQEFGRESLFCGYYVGPAGACRSPLALFTKLYIALDDGSIDDKMASYLTEFAVGHSLGQPMWDLLPLSSVPFQAANFDFFCRYAPRNYRVALQIGEIPSVVLCAVADSLRFITYPIWTMLSLHQRQVLRRRFRHLGSFLPVALPNEGVLVPLVQSNEQPFLQPHPSSSSDPSLLRDISDFSPSD
jgi:hypothetical protein